MHDIDYVNNIVINKKFVRITESNYTSEALGALLAKVDAAGSIAFLPESHRIYSNNQFYGGDLSSFITQSDLTEGLESLRYFTNISDGTNTMAAATYGATLQILGEGNTSVAVDNGTVTISSTGGAEVDVNSTYNSIVVDGSKYTLSVDENGKLQITQYTASSWGSCSFGSTTTSGASNTTGELETAYTAHTVTVTPANTISYAIDHGTEQVVLTGIKVGSSYAFGGDVTIVDGVISGADYVNANISSTYTLTGEFAQAATSDSSAAGDYSSLSTVTLASATSTAQNATLYYHEKGQASVSSKDVSVNSVTGFVRVTGMRAFYVNTGNTFSTASGKDITKSSLPTGNITVNFGSTETYGWMAFPAAWLTDGVMPKFSEYTSGNAWKSDGGWIEDNTATFSDYANSVPTDYRVFRTTNKLTGTLYYRVAKQ